MTLLCIFIYIYERVKWYIAIGWRLVRCIWEVHLCTMKEQRNTIVAVNSVVGDNPALTVHTGVTKPETTGEAQVRREGWVGKRDAMCWSSGLVLPGCRSCSGCICQILTKILIAWLTDWLINWSKMILMITNCYVSSWHLAISPNQNGNRCNNKFTQMNSPIVHVSLLLSCKV